MRNMIALLVGICIGGGFFRIAAIDEKRVIASYDGCAISDGGGSNFDGYMSLTEVYQCRQGRVSLAGKWGLKIQNGWQYHLSLGRQDCSVDFVGDMPLEMQRPKFQKWCQDKYGWELCGWNELPKVDHGKPPALKK